MQTDIEAILTWLKENKSDATIVGGQALAIWEETLGITSQVQTFDIDLLGHGEQGEKIAKLVGGEFTFSDPMSLSPNTAVITKNGKVLVDFLGSVTGVSEMDVVKRRVPIEENSGLLYLMSPVDCLVSKLANYFRLPEKRTREGLNQLYSAISVCEAYGCELLTAEREREVIDMANQIYSLALGESGKRAYVLLGIDLLKAMPDDNLFHTDLYKRENSPRLRTKVNEARKRYECFLKDRGLLKSSKEELRPLKR